MELDWAQKYRPTQMDEVILPMNIKNKISNVVNQKGGISLLFWGNAGCGKTTVAKLINPENTYQIDCSTDGSIEMVRGLERVCSTLPLEGGRRLILLDEADQLSISAQNAFRNVIEKYSMTTDFVMTANNPNKISEPIRSRCLPVHFDPSSDFTLIDKFQERVYKILETEGVEINDTININRTIFEGFPDFRRTLKQLQFDLG